MSTSVCRGPSIRRTSPQGPEASPPAPPLTAEQVLRDHAARIYSLARRLLENDADAEDVTQEVLLQVVRKLHTFRRRSSLTTWLHRVTVNAVLGYRRKAAYRFERQLRAPLESLPAEGWVSSPGRPWSERPDQQVLDRETHQLIEGAIAELPPTYRDVYVLADVEDLPNAEVGAILGLRVGAVKSRLHRARLMMRDALAPHFQEACA